MSKQPGPSDDRNDPANAALIESARRDVEAVEDPSPPAGGPDVSQALFEGYQVLQELHRGGQGVVYLAIERATQREVAIKLLREGPLASPADKARFEREVEILTQLEHPHIVAIRDSGVGASGQYFVMDYVEGEQLGADGADGRSMDETLRTFAKVCEAVNAAHLRGIIHRDLKPSNIRVDTSGEPRILDFGLAKVAASDAEASSMTATGQFMGSLPWASPEQAAGRPSQIDVRTDVYSLGVILYQMLTGRFPYDVLGNMRDVLDRIMKTDPARPSTIRRQISNEVETIVLKCLAKEPQRRYQSAGELARDVQHYLSGEPIEAKRDSLGYLLKKQLSKRKLPVAIAAAFAAVVAAGFVTALVLWQQAVEQRTVAEAQRERAEQQSERAEGNFELARDAVDQMLTRVADELKDRPHMEQTRRELLGDALAFYERFLEQEGDDPSVRYETARASRRVGDILVKLAEMDKAEDSFRQAIALCEALVKESPDPAEYRRELAAAHKALGNLLDGTSRPDEAGEQFHVNLQLREALVRDFPSEPEFRADSAEAHLFWGTWGWWSEDSDHQQRREQAIRRALAIAEDLVRDLPDARDHRIQLANIQSALGELLRRSGRLEEAEPLFRTAIALAEELLAEDPDDRGLLGGLAMRHNSLGAVLMFSGRDEAVEHFRAALKVGEKLAADHPDVPRYQSELGAQLHNLGSLLSERGQLEEAATLLDQARRHQRAAYELNPSNPQYARFLRNHLHLLGQVLTKTGKHVDAAAVVRQAPEVMPDDWFAQFAAADVLADCLRIAERDETLSEARRAALMNDYAEQAAEFLRETVARLPDDAGAYNELAWFVATSEHPRLRDAVQAVTLAERAVELAPEEGGIWNTLGVARYRAGDWPGAIEALNESMELAGGDATDWFFLAMAHWQVGDKDEARRWYDEAIEWMEEKKPVDEQLQRFRAETAKLMEEE